MPVPDHHRAVAVITIQTAPPPEATGRGRSAKYAHVYEKAGELSPGQWFVWPAPAPKNSRNAAVSLSRKLKKSIRVYKSAKGLVVIRDPDNTPAPTHRARTPKEGK